MLRYVIRRSVGGFLVIIIVSLVTFAIFQIVPVITHASPAYLYTGKYATPSTVAAVEHKLGLDKPLADQYLIYMKGIFVGRDFTDGVTTEHCSAPCFGYSFRLSSSVWDLIKSRFPVTLSLTVGAVVLWLFFGLGIGILSALRRGTFTDRLSMVIALAGVSLPVFFTGLIVQYLFSFGPTWLRWFPNPHYVPLTTNPWEWFHNMILPWVVLAFLYAALYARLMRANMLDVLGEDYIRTARAKGLPERSVIRNHAIRPAITPIVTILGLDIGALLGGAILTETVFSYPGLGYLAYQAIQVQDLPVILGVTIVAALFIVVANIVVDVMYAVVDPRVSYS